MPSVLGSGAYSVTLEWNRITWPVWLIAGALIYSTCLSAAVLAGWRPPGSFRRHRRVHE